MTQRKLYNTTGINRMCRGEGVRRMGTYPRSLHLHCPLPTPPPRIILATRLSIKMFCLIRNTKECSVQKMSYFAKTVLSVVFCHVIIIKTTQEILLVQVLQRMNLTPTEALMSYTNSPSLCKLQQCKVFIETKLFGLFLLTTFNILFAHLKIYTRNPLVLREKRYIYTF